MAGGKFGTIGRSLIYFCIVLPWMPGRQLATTFDHLTLEPYLYDLKCEVCVLVDNEMMQVVYGKKPLQNHSRAELVAGRFPSECSRK